MGDFISTSVWYPNKDIRIAVNECQTFHKQLKKDFKDKYVIHVHTYVKWRSE